MDRMIRRCAELHMQHIRDAGDPFESGSARPLDFGHWAAHKLESLTDYALRHGEAVAVGMALDTRYAALAGLLDPGECERVVGLLERLGFRLWDPVMRLAGDQGRPAFLAGLEEFREHLGGDLTITLLDAIGSGHEIHDMDPALIMRAAGWLAQRDAARGAG
jgi:3-dehydroquinate synthase